MQVRFWLMDAFTDRAFGGNPAGVIPDSSGMTDMEMQAIANELHASETAFLSQPTPGDSADFRIRYFTPAAELDLCGHATIGAVCGLVAHGAVPQRARQKGVLRLRTNVGVLPIRYGCRDGLPWAEMGQVEPRFRPLSESRVEVAIRLGIDPTDLDPALPLEMAYTGLWDLFVPVHSVRVVERLRPDLSALAEWNRQLRVVSTHVYTADTIVRHNHYHARNFAPAVGIAEDPASGTATGALLALLHKYGKAAGGRPYRFEQGIEIGRSSVIDARVEESQGSVRAYVGGPAVCTVSGAIHL